MNIGERIKLRRKALKLSVDEVASALGKDRATVYRYESNSIENFPTSILEPLAEILETTAAYLMGWTNNPAFHDDPDLPSGFEGAPRESHHADMQAETAEYDAAEEDIRFIARKMRTTAPAKRELLMSMIRAAFEDEKNNK